MRPIRRTNELRITNCECGMGGREAVSMQRQMPSGPQRYDEHRAAEPQPQERGCVRRGPAAAAPKPSGHRLESEVSPAANLLRLVLRAHSRAPGKTLARRGDFTVPRTARRQFIPVHSLAPNSPAQLGHAHARLRPAPPCKSPASLRARSAYPGRRSLAISAAPFPRHTLRPGTDRAPLWLRLRPTAFIASLWAIRIGSTE